MLPIIDLPKNARAKFESLLISNGLILRKDKQSSKFTVQDRLGGRVLIAYSDVDEICLMAWTTIWLYGKKNQRLAEEIKIIISEAIKLSKLNSHDNQ